MTTLYSPSLHTAESTPFSRVLDFPWRTHRIRKTERDAFVECVDETVFFSSSTQNEVNPIKDSYVLTSRVWKMSHCVLSEYAECVSKFQIIIENTCEELGD